MAVEHGMDRHSLPSRYEPSSIFFSVFRRMNLSRKLWVLPLLKLVHTLLAVQVQVQVQQAWMGS
jgi:hypothetical protein